MCVERDESFVSVLIILPSNGRPIWHEGSGESDDCRERAVVEQWRKCRLTPGTTQFEESRDLACNCAPCVGLRVGGIGDAVAAVAR